MQKETDQIAEQLGKLTGLQVKLVFANNFQERTRDLSVRVNKPYTMFASPSDKSYIDFPEASEWLKHPKQIGKFTRHASACIAGLIIRQDGSLRIFHFYSYTTTDEIKQILEHGKLMDRLLPSRRVIGGFFSSGTPSSKIPEEVMKRYESLGLTYLNPPDWFTGGFFGLMVDLTSREVIYSFTNLEPYSNREIPPL